MSYKLIPSRGGALGPSLQIWKGEVFIGYLYPDCAKDDLDEFEAVLKELPDD